jgi:uncharacterized protein YbbK (DUF523 family)
VSACLGGRACGVDGSCYGSYSAVDALLALPNVETTLVCPEEQAFGTPRSTCNIVNGDGFDVLAGRARVLTHEGDDWTDRLMEAADHMVDLALAKKVDLALLMDISAACGSTVIYDGHRDNKNYRRGVGVCTAKLIKAGIPVLSQRDLFSMQHLQKHLNPGHIISAAHDHYRGQWYQEYFKLQAK